MHIYMSLLDLCVSSSRRGHANILCIVPMLTDDPRGNPIHVYIYVYIHIEREIDREREREREMCVYIYIERERCSFTTTSAPILATSGQHP